MGKNCKHCGDSVYKLNMCRECHDEVILGEVDNKPVNTFGGPVRVVTHFDEWVLDYNGTQVFEN